MHIFLYINVLILAGFVLLLLREEMRFRKFRNTVKDTKEDLTTIVHQLRSPLGNLRKFTEFLQGKEFGNLSFSQQEAISKVQSSLGESLLLLDRLLARSRLDEGKVAMQSSSISLGELLQGVVDAVRPLANEKGHALSLTGKKTVRITADPLLLHGIFDEIVSNAIQYTPDGGKIDISFTQRDSRAIVDIKDTGIGISAAERPHLFEKFFRGERAKPMYPGNGLGLSFAKQFITRLGGTIQCRSSQGKGSTFIVSLRNSI